MSTKLQHKRDLQSDSDNLDNEHQDTIDSAAISLEEQIKLEEIALKALCERRGQVAQQLVLEEQKWHRLQEQKVILQERKVTVQEARIKHSSLRTELQESLQKSREKLSKLEKIEASVNENNQIILNINPSNLDRELSLLEDTAENDEPVLEETISIAVGNDIRQDPESNDMEQAYSTLRVPLLDALALNEHRGKSSQDTDMQPSSNFRPLLSMVNSKLVFKIMRHCEMEPMVLAEQQVKREEANYATMETDSSKQLLDSFASERAIQEATLRRGLLRNTCLDFLIMQPQKLRDGCDRKEEIDCMAGVSSSKDISETVLETESTSTTAALVVMDPNIPLCPYELSGICADEYCPYQHTDPNRKPILARELLPLPLLKLSQKEDKTERDTKPIQPKSSEESSSEVLPTPEDDPDSEEPAPEELVDETKAGDASEEEEEFITLPGMEEEQEEDGEEEDDNDMDIDESSAGEDNDGSDVISKDNPSLSNAFWWWSNQEISEWSHNLSLTQVVEILGEMQIVLGLEAPTKPQIKVPLPEDGSSKREWIGWLGRLVDCCRISAHAGRHDLAFAIVESLSLPEQASSTNDSDDEAPSNEDPATQAVMQALGEHELISTVEVLYRIRQVSYRLDSLPCSVFQQAFVVQLALAILSEYLKQLWNAEKSADSNGGDEQHDDSFPSVSVLLETTDLLFRNDSIPSRKDGYDDPTIDMKKLFAPTTTSYENQREIVRFAINTSRTLRSVQITRLEATVLKPIWSVVGNQLSILPAQQSVHYLKCIVVMGFMILSCLERFATNVERGKDALTPSLMAAMTSLDSLIQHILKTLGKHISEDTHLFNLTLTPLVAASVASACFLKQYSNAQNRLTTVMFRTSLSRPMWMQYSDLLWSQLVHLRMTLPVDSSEAGGNAINAVQYSKGDLADDSTKKADLADLMEALGVRLNYISLIGDSNFTDMRSRSDMQGGKLSTASVAIRRLILGPGNDPLGSQSIDLDGVVFGGSFGVDKADASTQMTSLLPRSILLTSQCVELSLQNCKLESLPPSFGLDLTNVIRLDVSYNSLHRLPISIASMTRLEELHLDHNMLTELAELPGSSLRVLNVSHNRLSVFPAFLLPDNGKITTGRTGAPKRKKMKLRADRPYSFQGLEALILAHNCLVPMESVHSTLVLNMKRLRRLEIEPQDTT